MSNPASFKVEVNTFSCRPTDWTSNGLRFATEAEAKVYGADLAWRWTMVKDWRVTASNDPANYRMVEVEKGRWKLENLPGGAVTPAS